MEKQLKDTLRLEPRHRAARLGMAELEIAKGDTAMARDYLDGIRSQAGTDADFLNLEARLAEAEGDGEKAESLYRASFATAANNITLSRLCGRLSTTATRMKRKACCETGWKNTRSDQVSWSELGRICMVSGQSDCALSAYKQAASINPSNAIALNNIAWTLHETDPANAIDYAEQALAIRPDEPEYLDTYAMALMHWGDNEKAMDAISSAIRQAPENGSLRYHRALINRARWR